MSKWMECFLLACLPEKLPHKAHQIKNSLLFWRFPISEAGSLNFFCLLYFHQSWWLTRMIIAVWLLLPWWICLQPESTFSNTSSRTGWVSITRWLHLSAAVCSSDECMKSESQFGWSDHTGIVQDYRDFSPANPVSREKPYSQANQNGRSPNTDLPPASGVLFSEW